MAHVHDAADCRCPASVWLMGILEVPGGGPPALACSQKVYAVDDDVEGLIDSLHEAVDEIVVRLRRQAAERACVAT